LLQSCKRMQTKCINFFLHDSISCLFAYYFRLWFRLNILRNNRLFYVNRSKCCQRPSSMGTQHCATSRAGYTSFFWPNPWPPNSPYPSLVYLTTWGVIPQPVYLLWEHNTDEQKQHLLKVWCWRDQCITNDATIHILVHVCGWMRTLEQYYDSINMISAIWHEMCHFCYTWYDF